MGDSGDLLRGERAFDVFRLVDDARELFDERGRRIEKGSEADGIRLAVGAGIRAECAVGADVQRGGRVEGAVDVQEQLVGRDVSDDGEVVECTVGHGDGAEQRLAARVGPPPSASRMYAAR